MTEWLCSNFIADPCGSAKCVNCGGKRAEHPDRAQVAALAEAETRQDPVEIGYTNWRGEYAVRKIIPLQPWFGSTDWHPEPQWLLKAIDVDKNAERDFAIKDIGFHPSPTVTDEMVEAAARAMCKSGRFETGEGTCALVCMSSLGDARRSCPHATTVHYPLARVALTAALEAKP